MQSQPTLTSQEQDAQLYRATLHELIELGTAMARDIAAQAARDTKALATTPDAPRPDHTIAFDRVARTVRRCILMARHIAKDAKRSEQARTQARTQVIRTVEDAITRARVPNPAETRSEFRERLDAPDLAEALDIDLQTRPIADVIEELQRDLGVAIPRGGTPWVRRTPDQVRTIQQAAARPQATPPSSRPWPPPSPPPSSPPSLAASPPRCSAPEAAAASPPRASPSSAPPPAGSSGTG